MPTALKDLIDARLRAGAKLADVEREVIATAPVDEERRSALWLYAWLCLSGATARRAAS